MNYTLLTDQETALKAVRVSDYPGPLLSICICSLWSRAGMLSVLLRHLSGQADQFPGQVEILVEADGGEVTTGSKRNTLYQRATGKYVCSVDDDDEVSDTYIEDILTAAAGDPDAIALNGTMSWDGVPHATWEISRHNPYITLHRPGGKIHYLRYHNHLSPIRRTIARQFPFPDKSFQEDYEFATAIHMAKVIKIESKVARRAYHYKYLSKK